MRLGVVTGLAREAACLTDEVESGRLQVVCSGAGSVRAAELATRLVAEGCGGLLSFGVAGGLDPRLRAGDLIISDSVVTPDGRRLETEPLWRRRLVERCSVNQDVQEVPVAGRDEAVCGNAEKADLRRRTGASSVDMESHMVAIVAAEAGVPFLVVRAIADTASQAVPTWLFETIDESGRTSPTAAALGALRRPWQIPALIRAGMGFSAAIRTLRGVAVDARPAFQFAAERLY